MLLASCGGNRDSPVIAGAVGAVTLSWVAPTENDDGTPLLNLSGFTLHYGTVSGDYAFQVVIENPSISIYIVEGLNPGSTYYFTVTAENSAGISSAYSNEVVRTVR